MPEHSIEIQKLPTDVDQLECVGDIDYLPQLVKTELGQDDVGHLVKHIKAIIDKELTHWRRRDGVLSSQQFNQAALNVSFRCYYQLLDKYCIADECFQQHIQSFSDDESILTECDCIILYFMLLTTRKPQFELEGVTKKALTALAKAVDGNDPIVLAILRTLNILLKKWPHLDIGNDLLLDHIYFCLQSNQLGIRDEMITIMQHACSRRETAQLYFTHIIHFWPWTSRNKLYLLGCILNKHKLNDLLSASSNSTTNTYFFNGLRSTLNYKSLLAPSQYVIKALSGQNSEGLLNVCLDIIINGSKQELRNFNAQWFARLQPCAHILFEMVRESILIMGVIGDDQFPTDPAEIYRLVMVSSMFSKEIYKLSPQKFSKFTRHIQSITFEQELETQLLIFKLIVDNLANILIEDWIRFLSVFLRKHMYVENAQFRNTLLGKMPVIINQLAKTYCKLSAEGDLRSTFEMRISTFFKQLQNDIEVGVCSSMYQPKIFGLKLLEILMKSLYGNNIVKNAKNCCIKQNQRLGEFLKQEKVFNCLQVCTILMQLLNDPSGFDDALQLVVTLIGRIRPDEALVNAAFDMSSKCSVLSGVDESNMSCLYARVAVENCSNKVILHRFMNETFKKTKLKLHLFEKDPLYACQSKGSHLFSSLGILNELVQQKPHICVDEFPDMLLLIEDIEAIILKMLNICNSQASSEVIAASFEDIDKSLQMLVSCSEYASTNQEMSRKYLLVSFWLTLKACCDLSASMSVFLIQANVMGDSRISFLQRCLQISVIVLTKCRHKGAIESAGVSIGKITKYITSHFSEKSAEYDLLHDCLKPLYDVGIRDISTTRRGAGFSIMFLHIVKNEEHRDRPILGTAIRNLLKPPTPSENFTSSYNCDRIEALHLHYLCVLVRDTELREATSKYYNEIMMAAITQIDNPEWTVCNGALQLFGALVPKIVGQRQATEFEGLLLWESAEVTFCEITRKLKMPFDYILNYCLSGRCSTRSIILFLEFLHKVEYIYKSSETERINEFRELVWCLLQHHCEKVRMLSAKCFVRSHEFSIELPLVLKSIAKILFSVKSENLFEGLVQTLYEGISKIQHDSKFVIPQSMQEERIEMIRNILEQNFDIKRQYKLYTLCKLWDLLRLLSFSNDSVLIKTLKNLPLPKNNGAAIAFDLWVERTDCV